MKRIKWEVSNKKYQMRGVSYYMIGIFGAREERKIKVDRCDDFLDCRSNKETSFLSSGEVNTQVHRDQRLDLSQMSQPRECVCVHALARVRASTERGKQHQRWTKKESDGKSCLCYYGGLDMVVWMDVTLLPHLAKEKVPVTLSLSLHFTGCYAT